MPRPTVLRGAMFACLFYSGKRNDGVRSNNLRRKRWPEEELEAPRMWREVQDFIHEVIFRL